MIYKDIRLKDDDGNYLYPLARKDYDENIISDTYLRKLSTSEQPADNYIKSASVSKASSGEDVLTLVNQDGEEVTLIVDNIARFG